MADPIVIRLDVSKAIASIGLTAKNSIALFQKAVNGAMKDAAAEIKRRGDADIMKAGNFSDRWTSAFQVTPMQVSDLQAGITVGFSDAIPYALIHEFGGVIRGRPLLWIPLSFGDAPGTGIGSGKVSARDYPGKLFRVERKGRNPLLFSDTGAQYVGVEQVTLRPRFHLRGIIANVVRTQLAKMFYSYLKKG
jgi:hypothetical protein